MSYEETLAYIHSVKWQGSKPGLSRTRALLSALGNPERQLRFVHIAGTNGKGSTAACIASCLQAAGWRVGLYTSPTSTGSMSGCRSMEFLSPMRIWRHW